MATFKYKDRISILVNGKIVETFINKKTTPLCETLMRKYITLNKGYAANSFTIMKT